MKRWMLLIATFFLFLLFCPGVSAMEGAQTEEWYRQQLEASGASDLTGRLPRDVQELLGELELDSLDPDSYTQLSFQQVTALLSSLLSRQSSGPLQALGMLMGAVLVTAAFSGLETSTLSLSMRRTYHNVAILSAGGLLLVPLFSLLDTVGQVIQQAVVFLTAYVPVYAGLIATGGRGVGAISYQATLLGASQLLAWLMQSVVLPVLTVSLAFGCAGSVAEEFCLDRFSQTLHKGVLWGLGLFSTVFSFLLSLQQMAASAGDSLGGRVMRFSLSSFVPVVGGLLGEAYSTVVGCAGLLRTTVGCFGVVAVVLMVLPTLLSCVCWSVGLHLAGDAAALFALGPVEKLCRTAAGAVRVLIAVLASVALLMIISTLIVSMTAGR